MHSVCIVNRGVCVRREEAGNAEERNLGKAQCSHNLRLLGSSSSLMALLLEQLRCLFWNVRVISHLAVGSLGVTFHFLSLLFLLRVAAAGMLCVILAL